MKTQLCVVWIIVVLETLLSKPGWCEGTVYVSDGSAQNVQYVHDNLAQNGDTITLPFGSFTWASGVTITKAITLQGAGVGTTIVERQRAIGKIDSMDNGARADFTPYRNRVSERRQNKHRRYARAAYCMRTNITPTGASSEWDNCKWNDLNGFPVINTVIGVIDHNTFIRFRQTTVRGLFLRDALGRASIRGWIMDSADQFRHIAVHVFRG